jgi:hypothetical protein
MTMNSFLKISYGGWVELVSWILSLLILVAGLLKFYQQKKRLKKTLKHAPALWDDDDDED